MTRRNPKNINDRLAVCDLIGGRFDGAQIVLDED